MNQHREILFEAREIYNKYGAGTNFEKDLAEQGIDDLADIEELDEEKAGELIMAARNICWFNEE